MSLKEKAAQMLEQVRLEIDAHFRSIGRWPSVREVVANIVTKVEEMGGDGASKREMAVEVALLAVRFVLPPAWSKLLPDWALRVALGWTVDRVVAAFNRTGWK